MFRGWILLAILGATVAAQQAPKKDQATFRVSGTVVDAVHGDLLSGIEVSIALNQAETQLRSMITGPDGRFEFAGLAAAKYLLTARGRGYLQQGYQQHHSASTGIVTGSGLASENLVFRLKPESAISGTVTDNFNDPVGSADVLLFPSDPIENPRAIFLWRRATTTDFGYFDFGHLPEGEYYLAVVAHPWYARSENEDDEEAQSVDTSLGTQPTNGYAAPAERRHSQFDVAFQTTYYANATEPGEATPVTLKQGEHEKIELHLYAVPALRLKVRGAPALGNATGSLRLSERIFNYSRQVASQGLDQDGAEFDGLAPGRYVLEYPAQATNQPQQQPLDLVSDTEIVPGEASKIVSTVTGTVEVGPDGRCQRCKVRLINLPSYEMFDAQPTSDGFQIEGGVRPGRYLVVVLRQAGYLIKNIKAVGATVVENDLEIPAGATVRLTISVTNDYAAVTGTAERDGTGVSQAAVLLVPDHPEHNWMLFRRDQSDSDGTFALRQVLPGKYTVIAVADGWDIEWRNPAVLKAYLPRGTKVQVQAGGEQQITVSVQPLEGTTK